MLRKCLESEGNTPSEGVGRIDSRLSMEMTAAGPEGWFVIPCTHFWATLEVFKRHEKLEMQEKCA